MNYNVMNYPQKDIDRFWSKVSVKYKDDGTPDFNACMEWIKYTDRCGYGTFKYKGKKYQAHRFSYTCFYGPPSALVLHKCDNPKCINPLHLWTGTDADNMKDRNNKNRQANGEKIHTSKLTESDVIQIKLDLKNGRIGYSLSEEYGVSPMVISHIKNNQIWKHVQI